VVPVFYTYAEDFGQAFVRLAGRTFGTGGRGRGSGVRAQPPAQAERE
jgi:hypothetical protein